MVQTRHPRREGGGGKGGSSDVLVGINVAPHLSSPQAQGWDWKKVGRPFRAVAWSCLGLRPHSWFQSGFGFEEEPRLLSERNRAVGEVGWGRKRQAEEQDWFYYQLLEK